MPEVYTLTAKPGSKSPVRPGVYKCKACREQFTVRIGTIFEESKIPLSKWLMAIHLMTSSKKGISSHQMARELGITQKSAWFLNHRIREAMKQEPMAGLLQGTVEVDETYIGGKPRNPSHPYASVGKERKRGRGTAKKPVMVLVERDGSARAIPLDHVNGKTLKGQIAVHVAKDAIVMRDEFPILSALTVKSPDTKLNRPQHRLYARRAKDGLVRHQYGREFLCPFEARALRHLSPVV